jgi:RNA polymerase sigma-70 factor (ECF subfamily)
VVILLVAQPQAARPADTARLAERLFRDFAPRVHRLARRLLGNETDAEDATQEVFVQVLRKLPTFRGEAALSTWLYRIAVNTALAYRRKRSARLRHESLCDPAAFADSRHRPLAARDNNQPDEPLVHGETHQLLERALHSLPEESRHVVVLADVEGRKCPEIARRLGVSVAAVKSRLHRGRLQMRQAVAGLFEATPPKRHAAPAAFSGITCRVGRI